MLIDGLIYQRERERELLKHLNITVRDFIRQQYDVIIMNGKIIIVPDTSGKTSKNNQKMGKKREIEGEIRVRKYFSKQ